MNVEQLQTPCFIIKSKEFEENIVNFRKALKKYYKNGILSYSVKTNSLPYLLCLAKKNGCYAEVVSHDEYMLALKCGYQPEHIIYNGPMKTKETFVEALQNGSYVNIENFREIDWLKEMPMDKELNLGIRLNIDLNKIAPDDSKEDDIFSRFGFSYENGEFKKALDLIRQYGFDISGMHIHRTSKTRSLHVYQGICKYANLVLEKYKLELKYIDVGGGFYGNMPGKPDYIEYVKNIKDHLNVSLDTVLILEPGNALIASPVEYVTTVQDIKNISDNRICFCDGSRIDIDPLFHKTDYWYDIVGQSDMISDEVQIITGCTCLEFDNIMKLNNAVEIHAGDKIVFHCVGAYTMTLTPNFIRLIPNVYSYDGNKLKLVRERWTATEWIQKSYIGE